MRASSLECFQLTRGIRDANGAAGGPAGELIADRRRRHSNPGDEIRSTPLWLREDVGNGSWQDYRGTGALSFFPSLDAGNKEDTGSTSPRHDRLSGREPVLICTSRPSPFPLARALRHSIREAGRVIGCPITR